MALETSLVGVSNVNARGYSDVYMLPKATGETEKETARLDLQHVTFRLCNGNIFTANIPEDVSNVLDLGCGSGVWLKDFSQQFPQAQLYGVDVHPPNIDMLPGFSRNIQFKQANIEDKWDFAQDIAPLDFIFDRLLLTSIRDWPFVLSECYQHLKPGGIIELQETVANVFAEDGSTAETSPAIRWHQVVRSALIKNGVDPDAAMHLSAKLRDVGFEIIADKEVHWNAFVKSADGDREKQIAANYKQALLNLFEMMTPKLFAQADLSGEERSNLAKEAADDVRNNSAERGFYAVHRIHIARKPLSS